MSQPKENSFKSFILPVDIPIPHDPNAPAAASTGRRVKQYAPPPKLTGVKLQVRMVENMGDANFKSHLEWLEIADAVAIYTLTPYLALCAADRCLLVSESGLGSSLNLSPPSSPRESAAPSNAAEIHPALIQLLTSDSIVKMGIDVTPLLSELHDIAGIESSHFLELRYLQSAFSGNPSPSKNNSSKHPVDIVLELLTSDMSFENSGSSHLQHSISARVFKLFCLGMRVNEIMPLMAIKQLDKQQLQELAEEPEMFEWPELPDEDSTLLEPAMFSLSVVRVRALFAHVQLPAYITNPPKRNSASGSGGPSGADSGASSPGPQIPVPSSGIASGYPTLLPRPVPQIPVSFSATPLPSQPPSAMPSPRTTERALAMLADLSVSYAEAQAIVERYTKMAQDTAPTNTPTTPLGQGQGQVEAPLTTTQLQQAQAFLEQLSPMIASKSGVQTPASVNGVTGASTPSMGASHERSLVASLAAMSGLSAVPEGLVGGGTSTGVTGLTRRASAATPSGTQSPNPGRRSTLNAEASGSPLVPAFNAVAGKEEAVTCVLNDPSYRFSSANPPTCNCAACAAFIASFARFRLQSSRSGSSTPTGVRTPTRSGTMTPTKGPSGTMTPTKSGVSTPNRAGYRDVKAATTLDLLLYKTAPCRRFNETGYCTYGNDCGFAHGEADLRILSPAERAELTELQRQEQVARQQAQAQALEEAKAAEEAAANKPAAWRPSWRDREQTGSPRPSGPSGTASPRLSAVRPVAPASPAVSASSPTETAEFTPVEYKPAASIFSLNK